MTRFGIGRLNTATQISTLKVDDDDIGRQPRKKQSTDRRKEKTPVTVQCREKSCTLSVRAREHTTEFALVEAEKPETE